MGAAGDTTPTAFSFTDRTDASRSTVYESDAIVVAGIDSGAAMTITGGEYQINGGAWASSATTVFLGDSIKVRGTSSASVSTAVNVVLTIGGVSDTYTITTVAESLDFKFAINGSFLDASSGSSSLVTFTRASTANYFNSSGLLVSAAIDAARFDYDPSTLAARGLLLEEARTNVVQRNRDLTNAAWTSTNVTAVKDQTGIDGVANSASRITATAGNGTCLQAITLASSARFQTAWVKRLVGSGVVNMTMNNGSTWTVISPTASWTRVSIPTATLANPTVGFRLVTSGDSIAVDFVQNENGAFATSEIGTTTASVPRSADSAFMTGTNFSNWYNTSEGTFVIDYTPKTVGSASVATVIMATQGAAAINRMDYYHFNSAYKLDVVVAGNPLVVGSFGTPTANVAHKAAFAFKLNDYGACVDGGTVATDGAATVPSMTQLAIALAVAGTSPGSAHYSRLRFFNTRRIDADLQSLTT
jgi:hypothetical protein